MRLWIICVLLLGLTALWTACVAGDDRDGPGDSQDDQLDDFQDNQEPDNQEGHPNDHRDADHESNEDGTIDDESVPVEPEEQLTEEQLTIETLATDLNVPWALQKDGDTFYLTERDGHIVKIEGNEVERQSLSLSEPVLEIGEGGLLGFVLAPDFDSSRDAYVYHTYDAGGEIKNRIVHIRLDEDEWEEQVVLLDDIPGDRIHNGGRLKIGPDGKLYATTGDAAVPEWSQDPDDLAGNILRMEVDGSVPDDNLFNDSLVYSYGHRNPQGLAWDEGGELYSSEHGPTGYDEINRIEPGANYGWPDIQGDETEEGMETPLFHSGTDTWAPSGTDFDADQRLYVTGLRGSQLIVFDVEAEQYEIWLEGEGRLRDVLIEGDNVYVVTNNTDGRGNPEADDDRLLLLKQGDDQ
jgi:glucose/arabinose dehydrogenase